MAALARLIPSHPGQNPEDRCPPLPIPLDKEAIKIVEANEIKAPRFVGKILENPDERHREDLAKAQC